MFEMRKSSIREVTWDEKRDEVRKLSKDLFDKIERISPDKSFVLYEAEYPYGEMIVDDKGHFRLPDNNGCLHSIVNGSLPRKMVKELNYNGTSISMGLVLQGQIHLFTENDLIIKSMPEVSSLHVFNKGQLFALNRVLDYPYIYQAGSLFRISAGSRTPYMIPGIGDQVKFRKVCKKFNINALPPQYQMDHWSTFSMLSNHHDFSKPWNVRLLFFGKQWVSKRDTLEMESFRLLLSESALEQSRLGRNSLILDKLWARTIARIRNKHVDRYIIAMARHIIEAALGMNIGFKVAAPRDAGPFDEIAHIFCNVYGLKKYSPIIVTPCRLSSENEVVYVSVQLPSIDLVRKRSSRSNFLLGDFREIYYVINRFTEEIADSILKEIPSYDISRFNLQFFAADGAGQRKDFSPSSKVFEQDKNAIFWKQYGQDKIFPYNQFLRACVRISEK